MMFMKEEDLETSIKVLVVGNGGVGKSSLIQRYCKGIFTRNYKKTIGVDFLEKQIEINGECVRLMLWDTAGQEEFDAITRAYYRGAQAAVLGFSILDRDSFEALENWKNKVESEVGTIPMVIISNKTDMEHASLVTCEECEALSARLGCKLFRTSVKENVNVNEVFQYLAEKFLQQQQQLDISKTSIGDDLLHVNGHHGNGLKLEAGIRRRPKTFWKC